MQASIRLSQRTSQPVDAKTKASALSFLEDGKERYGPSKHREQIKLNKSQIKQSVLLSLRDQAAYFDFRVF
jgi:hypothetical protein